MAKKILHISKYYYPSKGGIESIARDVVLALADEYEQLVLCFNDLSDDNIEEAVDYIKVIRCKCELKVNSQAISIFMVKKLKLLMKSYKPDYVFLHVPNPFMVHFCLKYVVGYSKLITYWHSDIIRQKLMGKLLSGQCNRLIKHSHKVIATSPNYVQGSRYLAYAEDKCVIVPNCIDENVRRVTKQTTQFATYIREENKNKIICLAVGRFVKYKGFEYLIRTSKLLDNRFVFYIIGQGPLSERYRKLIGTDTKVHLTGSVSDDTLTAYYQAADIFTFPSITKNEAFGVALAEAMYFELPAITFTIPGSGVNFVNVDQKTGVEVPNCDIYAFADALRLLADHYELRMQYARAARHRVEEQFMYRSFKQNIRNILSDEDCG